MSKSAQTAAPLSPDARSARRERDEQLRQLDFDSAPLTIAWEVTRACAYACLHYRADAQPQRDAFELTTGPVLGARFEPDGVEQLMCSGISFAALMASHHEAQSHVVQSAQGWDQQELPHWARCGALVPRRTQALGEPLGRLAGKSTN